MAPADDNTALEDAPPAEDVDVNAGETESLDMSPDIPGSIPADEDMGKLPTLEQQIGHIDEEAAKDVHAAPTEEQADEKGAEAKDEKQVTDEDEIGEDDILLASSVGMTEDEVKAFPTKAAFDAAINTITRRFSDEKADAQTVPAEVPKAAEATPAATQTPVADGFKFDLGEEFDETASKELDRYEQYNSARSNQLLDHMKNLFGHLQTVVTELAERDMDDFVTAVGDEGQGFLGKGATALLDQKSDAWRHRHDLDVAAEQLRANTLRRTGRKMPKAQALQLALRSLAPELRKTDESKARAQLDAANKRRNSQAISKPGGRRSKSLPPGERKAEESIAKAMRQMGMT